MAAHDLPALVVVTGPHNDGVILHFGDSRLRIRWRAILGPGDLSTVLAQVPDTALRDEIERRRAERVAERVAEIMRAEAGE